jgi:hypothetical protein
MTTVTLKEPLKTMVKETGEVVSEIKEVSVTPFATGTLLDAMDESGGRQGSLMRSLISKTTRLSHADVDRLDLEDFAAISEEMERFLPASLRTGALGSNS